MTPLQCKMVVAYHISNHNLAFEIVRWLTTPIFRDTKVCHLFSYNAFEIRHILVLECSLCSLMPLLEISFPSLFEKVVLWSLESFLQCDHQVDISLYLMEAITLRHSRELVGLKSSSCTFSHLAFRLPGLWNQFHFMAITHKIANILQSHGTSPGHILEL